MFGNLGAEKLILLFVIALIVLGPDRLPAAARSAGRVLAEFRRITGGLQGELRDALNDPKDELTASLADVRHQLDSVRQDLGSVRQGLSSTLGLSGGVGAVSDPAPWTSPALSKEPATPLPPDDPSLN